jgi:hypothetical protein
MMNFFFSLTPLLFPPFTRGDLRGLRKIAIFPLLFLSLSYGTTIHVPADFPTIQDGLNTAIEEDSWGKMGQ